SCMMATTTQCSAARSRRKKNSVQGRPAMTDMPHTGPHTGPQTGLTKPAPRFQEILLLIGQLNYTWTNTESLLIYLIAGLARVDKETAIVIFLTLNTTRARIELVERLAKLGKTLPEQRHEILAVTGQLTHQAKL